MKFKILSLLGVTAMIGLASVSLTSCGNRVANAGEEFKLLSIDDLKANSSESNPIEVIFWHSFGDNIANPLRGLIDDFEDDMASQGIYITVKENSTGGGYDGLRSQINMGTPKGDIPTMCLGYPDHFSDYIDNEILLPLDSYVNATDTNIGMTGDYDKNDFVDTYWSEVNMKNKNGENIIAGIPFNKSTEVMYYNASAIDPILIELGIIENASDLWENPTWEQVETVSLKLIEKVNSEEGLSWTYVDGHHAGKFYSTSTKYPTYIDSGSNFFITALRQYCQTKEEASNIYTNDGKAVFKNNKAVEAIKWFQDRATKGANSSKDTRGIWNLPNAVGQGYGSSLMNNNEAFISIGSTAGANHNDSANYQLKVTTVPQFAYDGSRNNAVIQQGTNAAILTKNSNNLTRLAAWLLIRYLTNTENTAQFSMDTGYLPVRESAIESETFQNFLSGESADQYGIPSSAKAIIAADKEKQFFYTDPAFKGSSVIRDQVDLMMVDIMCEGDDIVSSMTDLYRKLDDLGIETVDSYKAN